MQQQTTIVIVPQCGTRLHTVYAYTIQCTVSVCLQHASHSLRLARVVNELLYLVFQNVLVSITCSALKSAYLRSIDEQTEAQKGMHLLLCQSQFVTIGSTSTFGVSSTRQWPFRTEPQEAVFEIFTKEMGCGFLHISHDGPCLTH